MKHKETDMKKLQVKARIGLFIFTISVIGCTMYLNHVVLGLVSILGLLGGWLLFSTNHTKITLLKLKEITQNHIRSKPCD